VSDASSLGKVERALQRGLSGRQFVRVERHRLEDGHMDGRVLAVGRGLVVLALINDDVLPDGLVVLRIPDITAIHSPAPYAEFLEKALSLRGRQPASWLGSAASAASSWSSVLAYAAEHVPLVSVHTEEIDPDVVL
jgi:hypothetical protein